MENDEIEAMLAEDEEGGAILREALALADDEEKPEEGVPRKPGRLRGKGKSIMLARRILVVQLRSKGHDVRTVAARLGLSVRQVQDTLKAELREIGAQHADEADTLRARELVSLDRWQRQIEAKMEKAPNDRLAGALLRLQERRLALSGVAVVTEASPQEGAWATLHGRPALPAGSPETYSHLPEYQRRMLLEASALGAAMGAGAALASQAASQAQGGAGTRPFPGAAIPPPAPTHTPDTPPLEVPCLLLEGGDDPEASKP